jgi:hypothetical protein
MFEHETHDDHIEQAVGRVGLEIVLDQPAPVPGILGAEMIDDPLGPFDNLVMVGHLDEIGNRIAMSQAKFQNRPDMPGAVGDPFRIPVHDQIVLDLHGWLGEIFVRDGVQIFHWRQLRKQGLNSERNREYRAT